MRNPKLEVFEAGLVVLEHADGEFAELMLHNLLAGLLTPEKIFDILVQRAPRNKSVPPEAADLPGFTGMRTAYDKRLMTEWQHFFVSLSGYSGRHATAVRELQTNEPFDTSIN